MGNRKYTSQQRVNHLKQYKKTGLSRSEYCKKHNIAQGTFYGWLKMIGNEEQTPQIFPVEVVEPTPTTQLSQIVITFPNCVKVETDTLNTAELLTLINGYKSV